MNFNLHGGRIKGPWTYAQRGLFDPDDVDGPSFNFIDRSTGDFRDPFNCPSRPQDRRPDGGCASLGGHVYGGKDRLHDASTPEPVDEEINLWGAALTTNYDMDTRLGPVTLTSITAIERVDSTEWEDLDSGPLWLYHYRADDRSHQFSQELRLASDGDSRLQWLTGAWYFQSNIRTRADAYLPPDGTIGRDFGFWTKSIGGDKFFTENYAFFGEASYELTERLTFTGGLRYSWERKQSRQDASNFLEYDPDDPEGGTAQGTPCGSNIDIHYDPANCGQGRDESDSWQAISGKAVLDYQLTDDIMVYASYKRGFKSGGFSASLGTQERADKLCMPTETNDCSDAFNPEATFPAPNYSGSGSIAYEINVGDGVARAQVSTSFSDKVHFYADNLARHAQGSVWLLNGNFSYRLPDDRTEISLWIRNWNDKVYVTNIFDIAGFGLDQLGSSRPRMYGVTVRYDF